MKHRIAIAWIAAAVGLAATSAPARADMLTTTFAGGNGFDGNMFDVTAPTSSLSVTALGLNLAAGSYTIQVYEKSGTFVGSETNASAWTLIQTTANVVSTGQGKATTISVAGLTIAGMGARSALYITTEGTGTMEYTNGTAVGNVLASNANLTIYEGVGKQYPFAATFTPRDWNGTVTYSLVGVPEPGSVVLLGLGAVGLVVAARRRAGRAA